VSNLTHGAMVGRRSSATVAALVVLSLICWAAISAPAARAADPQLIGQWHLDEGATGNDDRTSTRARACQDTIVIRFDDVAALEWELAQRDVACVLTEPALTNRGIVRPRPGFHASLRELCTRTGTVLIIDEAHTFQCGRGGLTWAWQLEPDVVTLGKSLGRGRRDPGRAHGRASLQRQEDANPAHLRQASHGNAHRNERQGHQPSAVPPTQARRRPRRLLARLRRQSPPPRQCTGA
jgi:Aminotransferase class-III